jgi:hypothetical protein
VPWKPEEVTKLYEDMIDRMKAAGTKLTFTKPSPLHSILYPGGCYIVQVPDEWIESDKTRRDGLRVVKYRHPSIFQRHDDGGYTDGWKAHWSVTWSGNEWWGSTKRKVAVSGAENATAIDRLGDLVRED